MAGLFVSYRRQDCIGDVDRIDERLRKRFRDQDVFLDRRSLQPSERFDAALVERIRTCDVFIAIVGPHWMARADDGGSAIRHSADYVRLEIREALARRRPIVPVLVRGAGMPPAQELPDDIRPFALTQAHEIHDGHFDEDVRELVRRVLRTFREPRSALRRWFLLYRPRRPRSTLVWMGFHASLVLAVAHAVAVAYASGRSAPHEVETIGTAMLVLACAGLRLCAPIADRSPPAAA